MILEVPDFKNGKGRFFSSSSETKADDSNKSQCTDRVQKFTIIDLDDPASTQE